VNIRAAANWCAATVGIVGLAGYAASGLTIFGLLFLGSSLFLFTNIVLRWIAFGIPQWGGPPDDLTRADDDKSSKPSILPPHWPGQS